MAKQVAENTWNTNDIAQYAKAIIARNNQVRSKLATASQFTTYGLVHLTTQLNKQTNAWQSVFDKSNSLHAQGLKLPNLPERIVKSNQFAEKFQDLVNSSNDNKSFNQYLKSDAKLIHIEQQTRDTHQLQYDHNDPKIWNAKQMSKYYDRAGAMNTNLTTAKQLFNMSDRLRVSTQRPYSMIAYADAVKNGAFIKAYQQAEANKPKDMSTKQFSQDLFAKSKQQAIYNQGIQHAKQQNFSKDMFYKLSKMKPTTSNDRNLMTYFKNAGRSQYFAKNNPQKAQLYQDEMANNLQYMTPKTNSVAQKALKSFSPKQINYIGLQVSKNLSMGRSRTRSRRSFRQSSFPHKFHRSFSKRTNKWSRSRSKYSRPYTHKFSKYSRNNKRSFAKKRYWHNQGMER